MKFFRKSVIKRRMRAAARAMDKLNSAMIRDQMPRWKRQQIWRDIIKSDAAKAEVINLLGGKR